MPMIDVYATEGTFEQGGQLAADLARTLMVIEGVPDIPMFRLNTAAFIHQMPAGSISNVGGPGHTTCASKCSRTLVRSTATSSSPW